MNKAPFLSVIIPAYNTCAYLPACVDSILGQSYSDFEVILVDDGSTDGSADICDKYAGLDARVRCIHKVNEGVSAARNDGLSAARGLYVWFCDSDDIVRLGAFEKVCACIMGSEPLLVTFPVEQVDSDGRVLGIIPAPTPSLDKHMGPLQCGDPLFPHTHVFSRALAGEERFDTSLTLLEDRDFFYRLGWKAAGSTSVINEPLYRYLITREDSAVNSSSVKRHVESHRVNYEILLNELSLGYPMPAFELFADHTIGVLAMVSRYGSDKDDFQLVRSRLVEHKAYIGVLHGALKVKCQLAVSAPGIFKLLARLKR